MRRRITNKQ